MALKVFRLSLDLTTLSPHSLYFTCFLPFLYFQTPDPLPTIILMCICCTNTLSSQNAAEHGKKAQRQGDAPLFVDTLANLILNIYIVFLFISTLKGGIPLVSSFLREFLKNMTNGDKVNTTQMWFICHNFNFKHPFLGSKYHFLAVKKYYSVGNWKWPWSMRFQGLTSPPIHRSSGISCLGVGKLWYQGSGVSVVILVIILFLSSASYSSYFNAQFLK